jgi:hypothetical protein
MAPAKLSEKFSKLKTKDGLYDAVVGSYDYKFLCMVRHDSIILFSFRPCFLCCRDLHLGHLHPDIYDYVT